MDAFDITASALTAQRLRMDVISSNLANVNTTRREDGSIGSYRRKNVVFAPIYADAVSRQGISGFGGGMSGFAKSLSLKPTSSGVSIGPNGQPMLTVGIRHGGYGGTGVQVTQITDDGNGNTMRVHFPGHPDADAGGYIDVPADMKLVYDPSHPDAIPTGEQKGYVIMPNVNVVTEMVDMISATRAYEANVTALQNVKQMGQAALDI